MAVLLCFDSQSIFLTCHSRPSSLCDVKSFFFWRIILWSFGQANIRMCSVHLDPIKINQYLINPFEPVSPKLSLNESFNESAADNVDGNESVTKAIGCTCSTLFTFVHFFVVTARLQIRGNGRNIFDQQLPTLLGVVESVCTLLKVSRSGFKLCATTPNNRQWRETGCANVYATFTIEQYWELLANNVASVCTGLYDVNSRFMVDASKPRQNLLSLSEIRYRFLGIKLQLSSPTCDQESELE